MSVQLLKREIQDIILQAQRNRSDLEAGCLVRMLNNSNEMIYEVENVYGEQGDQMFSGRNIHSGVHVSAVFSRNGAQRYEVICAPAEAATIKNLLCPQLQSLYSRPTSEWFVMVA